MNDYKSMQKRMTEQGASDVQIRCAVIEGYLDAMTVLQREYLLSWINAKNIVDAEAIAAGDNDYPSKWLQQAIIVERTAREQFERAMK